ncbi:protein MKS1-like [Primulina eburnea]|uniref:protein MKS1-like n=1 Tax=Primulina eburnea TaxID=1245227 RepID=UPI003C6C2AE9
MYIYAYQIIYFIILTTTISDSLNSATMDMPDIPFVRSPRREIQGPRPTPLKVRKDSHKIRKPPVAPPPAAAAAGAQHHYPYSQPRPPVIIYTVSPKIIHANPNEFMSLVQRLTGPNSSSATISSPSVPYSSSSFQFQDNPGAISPAARLASIEKTRSPEGRKALQVVDYDVGSIQGIEIGTGIQRTGQFPGILSPNPNALPPIPPNFFSPPSDSNPLNFFPDFSPALHSNRSYLDNSFLLPSPSTLFSPQINMPSPNTLHLFNTLFDL